MSYFKVNYARVRSNELATGSCDPVAQHMQAWKIYQHELKVQRAKPWEIRHVNPGKKQTYNKEERFHSPIRSFSRLSLQTPMCVGRAPSSLRSLQTKVKKDVKISYSAHIESHKKFETLNIDKEKTFKPKILNTLASSKLIQSRNYQPPKKTHQKKRINSANSAATSGKSEDGNNIISNKNWSRRAESSCCSSSTVSDSAYEAGGSIEGYSPQSRGSTPGTAESPKPRLPKDVKKDECAPLTSAEVPEEIERPGLPIKMLDRNVGLDYIFLEHDLVTEIASAGVLTNASVKEVCRTYLSTRAKGLDQEKVAEIVERVHSSLGIPDGDTKDSNDFGLFESSLSNLSIMPTTHPEAQSSD